MGTMESIGELDRIAGRYRPIRVLGRGGMGRVFEAEDLHEGTRVALKLPLSAARDDPQAQARFVREAQTAASIDHPNVVRVLDVVRHDEHTPVMVLELLEGDSLAAYLRERGRLSLTMTAAVLVPVLEALREAHRRGLIHRDFKPDNIFLARQPDGSIVPKLLDFGITKALPASLLTASANTSADEVVGTPDYMAPEQVFGDADIDTRVDVWAAGVVVYECLAGVRPFVGTDVGEVLRAILLQPPVPLLQHVDTLPAELAIAVGDALHADVDARARTLAPLLEPLLARLEADEGGEEIGALLEVADADPERGGGPRAGQRRPLTVLIAAVEHGAAIDPQRAFRQSMALRSQGRALADELGAQAVEHSDSGVALVFGLESARTSDAMRAIHAAERLQDRAHDHGREDGDERPALAIGVATGQVEITEALAAAPDLAASWAKVPTWRDALELAQQALPGSTKLGASVERVVQRPSGPPIGRRPELRRVMDLLDECLQRGIGAVVLLRGEAGIGKTTLAQRSLERARERGLRPLAAPIFDFGAQPEYDLARGLFGELVLEHHLALTDQHRLVLDELLRLPASEQIQAQRRALEPERRASLRGAAIRRLLELAAAARPLLLWVDDVHWADRTSLSLITQLVEARVGLPIVLMLTTRPAEAPQDETWLAALRAAKPLILDLGPLSEDDALALARRHADSEALAQRCVERAKGNPLFLLAMVHDLDPAGASIPVSVNSIVTTKLDRLGEAALEVAHAAAVLGRRFSVAALEHMVPGASMQLPGLVDAELLVPDLDAHLFRHDLVRDAVYASLVTEARDRLHRQAASWYRERDPLMVARHLDGARALEAAAAYLDAARHERGIQRLASALALARRGEQLAHDDALGCELALTCGELERKLGLVAESLATFRDIAQHTRDEGQRLRAYLGQASALNLSDRNDEALRVLERARVSTERPKLLAAIHSLRGNILFSRGDPQACLHEQGLALDAARQAGDLEAEAKALNGIGDAHYMQGRHAEVLATLERCIELSQRAGLVALESMSWSVLATSQLFRLDIPAALSGSARALALAEQAMDAKAQVLAGLVVADARVHHLELDEAERVGLHALSVSRRVGTLRLTQYVLVRLAWAAEQRGDIPLALRRLDEAWALTEAVGKLFMGAMIRATMAALAPARASAWLDEGEAILARSGVIDHNIVYFHSEGIRAAFRIRDAPRLRRFARALTSPDQPSPWRILHAERGQALADLLEAKPDARAHLDTLSQRARVLDLRWFMAQTEALLAEWSR